MCVVPNDLLPQDATYDICCFDDLVCAQFICDGANITSRTNLSDGDGYTCFLDPYIAGLRTGSANATVCPQGIYSSWCLGNALEVKSSAGDMGAAPQVQGVVGMAVMLLIGLAILKRQL